MSKICDEKIHSYDILHKDNLKKGMHFVGKDFDIALLRDIDVKKNRTK